MNQNVIALFTFVVLTVNARPEVVEEGPTKINVAYGANIGVQPHQISRYEPKADYGFVHVLNGPPTKIESAVLEQESLLSQKDSAYTAAHELFANIFGHKPVVDTLRPHEKFGNDGEKFKQIGKFVVGKAEGVANLLNVAVDLPYKAFKHVVQKTSDKLNHLGAKIVGLEK